MQRSAKRGFTLIELMVVVAIIALLTAIAYPSYITHVRKTRYSQAKEAAQEVASALERAVAQTTAYPETLAAASILQPYSDIFTITYTPQVPAGSTSTLKTSYTLIVKEQDSRFGLWVGINGAGTTGGTHCGCDGKVCTASSVGAFTSSQTSCSGSMIAF
jgi:type IV pilus assembly protein PilE